jgi:nucleolar protein 56
MGVHYKIHHLLGELSSEGSQMPSSEVVDLSYPQYTKELRSALSTVGKEKHHALRIRNLALTKEAVKKAVTSDILVISAIKSLGDMDKVINTLTNRLRDWYEMYLPEYSAQEKDQEKFVKGVLIQNKDAFLKKEGKESFGADLNAHDLKPLHAFAQHILTMHSARKELMDYLDSTMRLLCPNLRVVAGVLLGAKLLEHAGSLRRLATLPSSTIQILGAEKALFRHLKTGAKPPKYGVLLAHSLVQEVPRDRQGKAARVLADKLTLAVRIDYFKGEFRGDQLLADARKKLLGGN